MLRLVATADLSGLLAIVIAGFLSVPPRAAAAAPLAGPVTGVIDAVRYEGDQFYVFGWACQQGNRSSIDVHIYAGHAAGGTPAGTFVTGGKADVVNEPAVEGRLTP